MGTLDYADDIVLCASALGVMLSISELFASSSGLCFNPSNTQLIRFCLFDSGSACDEFIFCGLPLRLSSSVIHLGNKFSYNLLDDDDILIKTRQLSWAVL